MALQGHPHIAAETAKRIIAEAERLGYRPDPGLSAIAKLRWRADGVETGRVIAFVHDVPAPRLLSSIDRYEGARASAERFGYKLVGFRLSDVDGSCQRLGEMFSARAIQGVVFDAALEPAKIAGFPLHQVCAVWCGTREEGVQMHTVEVDAFRRVEIAWEQARATGARRIGLLITHSPVDERLVPVLAAYGYLAKRARSGAPGVLDISAIPKAAHSAVLRAWITDKNPDLVIASGNGGYHHLLELGVQIPRDLGYISLHIWPDDPRLSGFPPLLREQGEAAVRLLRQELLHLQLGPPEIPTILTLKPRWQAGTTLRAAHEAK